tara:strand:- start:6258 stop:6926 length:669 start_codon:yes stop_codon:yes gene_type:complete
MLLKAENISKAYKNKEIEDLTIFKNLSFEVKDEKITTIYGPSGIGKSTLLNILGTVDTPDSGMIELDSIIYNSKNYLKLRKRYISYMFQFHYLLPEFTIYDNLKLVLDIKQLNHKSSSVIFQTLDRFGIADKAKNYPHHLSGGEKQRVSLARAIISDPLIVLADEPTGNLDNENSVMIASEIKKITNESNIKFIIATHDTIFKNISDRICCLKKFNIFDMNE